MSTDPQVAELRQIHFDLDRAILAAYGCHDVPILPYLTPETAPTEPSKTKSPTASSS